MAAGFRRRLQQLDERCAGPNFLLLLLKFLELLVVACRPLLAINPTTRTTIATPTTTTATTIETTTPPATPTTTSSAEALERWVVLGTPRKVLRGMDSQWPFVVPLLLLLLLLVLPLLLLLLMLLLTIVAIVVDVVAVDHC